MLFTVCFRTKEEVAGDTDQRSAVSAIGLIVGLAVEFGNFTWQSTQPKVTEELYF